MSSTMEKTLILHDLDFLDQSSASTMTLTVKKNSEKNGKPLSDASTKEINKLGHAPTDIYALEDEIASIRLEEVLQSDDDFKTATFTTSTISDARKHLESGQQIHFQLPPNPTPHALIAMTHRLGFDTRSLTQTLKQSSVAAKHALDDYLSSMNPQCAHGYLSHCTNVEAMECGEDFSAKLKVVMDLDFKSNVLDDDSFSTKFIEEISQNVFKCDAQQIRVDDIRAGSVIVVVSGITLITLAMAGVIALSLRLYHRKKDRQQIHGQHSMLRLDASRYTEVKGMASADSLISSKSLTSIKSMESNQSPIFSSLSINNNNNDHNQKVDLHSRQNSNYSVRSNSTSFDITTTIPEGTETAATGGTPGDLELSENAEKSYSKLIAMGFEGTLCRLAVRQYPNPGDMDQAIDWILSHPQAANTDDGSMQVIDASDGFVAVNQNQNIPEGPILGDAVSRELVGDDDGGNYVSLSVSGGQQSTDEEEEQEEEEEKIYVGDPVWIKKKGDQLSAAKVIAMSSTTVTVQYENGGLFWWKKTEVIPLGDRRLVTVGSKMAPQFEGCVEISRSSGGYIKAWKTGFQRPMADL